MKISSIPSTALVLLSFVLPGTVSAYSLTDTVIGSSFYKFFTWEAIGDPTHGRVLVLLLSSPFFWSSYFACLPPQETTWTKLLPSTLILPSPPPIHSSSEPIILVFWALLTLEEILLGLNQRRPIPTTSRCMSYMIMALPCELKFLTSSFDIRHMPQGCGCVNRSIQRRIADDVWQDLACCVGD